MKVLLVRLSSMGDLIHTMPAIDDLAKKHPNLELHWLCERSFFEIAGLHPFVKKVHVMGWRQWRKKITHIETWQEINQLKQSLRQEQFDFVLDSQGLIKSALFARLSGSPVLGLDKNSARESVASLVYQKSFSVVKGKDAIRRNRELFAKVFDYIVPDELNFGLVVPKEACFDGLSKPYYVALHATSKDSKLWPMDYWVELLKRLCADYHKVVYLPWGNEKEKLRAEQIASLLPFAVVCNKLTLLQAAYLLKNAVGVVGVDTGLLHLANALSVPVVGVYTDTDPAKTGVQVSRIARNLGGVHEIPSVDEVYNTLLSCIVAET